MWKPKQTKFRKYQKGRVSNNIRTNQKLLKKSYGIVVQEGTRITGGQISAVELAIKRLQKVHGETEGFIIRLFPHIPVTKKPIETRMGKGKGNIEYWMTRVKAGAIIMEYGSSNENLALEIWKVINSKLPIKTKIVKSR